MASVADILATARTALGKPYVMGAEGPNAFDCSGLVQWAYGKHGIKLPRTTWEQVKVGAPVARSQIQPGDLVFSTWDGGKKPGHVGIYVGDGKLINAPQAGQPVGYATMNDSYWQNVDAVRRVTGVATSPVGSLPGGGGFGIGLVPAVQAAADGLRTMAGGVTAVGDLARKAAWLALPTTGVRIMSGVLGVGFLLVGVRFLVKEVRA